MTTFVTDKRIQIRADADDRKVIHHIAGSTVYYGGPYVTATSNDGTLTAGSQLAVSQTVWLLSAGDSKLVVAERETRPVFEDEIGNVVMGDTTLIDLAPSFGVGNKYIARAGFYYDEDADRVFMATGRFGEVGDPPDIAYGRAPGQYPWGPLGWGATLDGEHILPAAGELFSLTCVEDLTPNKFAGAGVVYVSDKVIYYARLGTKQFLDCWSPHTGTLASGAEVREEGIGRNIAIASPYWTPWMNKNGGGGGYQYRTATHFSRTLEPSVADKSGGSYVMATTPVGTVETVDRIIIRDWGGVGVVGPNLQSDQIAARLQTGGDVFARGTVTGGRTFDAKRGYLAHASGVALPVAELHIRATGTFPTSGDVLINGDQIVSYTGQVDDGTRTVKITGCTGGTGTMPNFAHVVCLPASSDNTRGIEMGRVGPSSELGLNAQDVNLYRRAANELKTDDKLITTEGLGLGNATLTSGTPGTVVRKAEVFGGTGTSIGFIAVYDAIT